MPATSPSPQKRPSLAERSSSTHSLSSSGRPANANKSQTRIHVVNKHQRNVSHGKGLNKLGKVASGANITAEAKNHQRKKSGPVTPTESPRTSVVPNIKRNSSHAAMPKNNSSANLRKNHSASALASKRNRSHGALMKLGAAPQKHKEAEQKQGVFALGDQSSDDEDEEQWEDSTTQSPEMSRNQSKASTPLRPRTPNNDVQNYQHVDDIQVRRAPEPPHPTISATNNKSAPNLKQPVTEDSTADPALLQNTVRSSRAPPVMSTISAQMGNGGFQRSDSARSLTMASQGNNKGSNLNNSSPKVGTASSGSGGVSHFLPSSSLATSAKTFDTASDDDSASGFISNHKTQPSESPEKPRSFLNKIQSRAAPSRTNQKMELQRRETMRAGAAAPGTPGPPSLSLSAGSAVSLHSRSGSKAGARNRSMAGEMKAIRQDYDTAVRQLTVTRRFRNPILESLHRLQESEMIPSDVGPRAQTGSQTKSRPQSRHVASATATPKHAISRSPEEKKITPPHEQRSAGHARHSRVQFQVSRQGSHDDIGLTTSQGSPGGFEEEQDGVSPEEALIRRIWESRVVFENDGVQTAA